MQLNRKFHFRPTLRRDIPLAGAVHSYTLNAFEIINRVSLNGGLEIKRVEKIKMELAKFFSATPRGEFLIC